MRIEHIAVWTPDIEVLRSFYCRHFGCVAGDRYENHGKGFCSYFLRFTDGARFEIMQKTGIANRAEQPALGLAHFAVAVGSELKVIELTNQLHNAGIRVISEPRRTGDGYFESVVLDPDGNAIEITS